MTLNNQQYFEKELTSRIIGAAIEVHRELGPGLLESAYQVCLAHEFGLCGLAFEKELLLPIQYKGQSLESDYRLDFIVERKVLVETKSVEALLGVHEAQLLTYLKLTGCKIGLLINFNVPMLTKGIRRLAL